MYGSILVLFFFFFSSRRRHTRFDCDWSSDVCSSDLVVGDSYVKPVMSEDLNQRLASMKEQILSRTRLQHLVEKFGLYKKDANSLPMEALVERLQKSIAVTPLSPMQGTQSAGVPVFNVEVTFGEARVAQQICSEITSMFIEQNLHLHE